MNKFLGVGRFTKDPSMHEYGQNGSKMARFTLAVDRRMKRDGADQTADFIPCMAFGKTAEFIEKYFGKGKRIGVEGRIQTGSYTNKDGDKVYTTDVVVENVEFVEKKNVSSSSDSSGYSQPSPADAESQASVNKPDDFMDIPDGLEDEELPFG